MKQEVVHKELDLIQAVIKKMETNSFMIKGWLISLITVTIALTKETILSANSILTFLALTLPIIAFWYLDAYFLKQERIYRKLYEWVVVERKKGNEEHLYSLSPHNRFETANVLKIMFSGTLLPFYLIPIILLFLIIIFAS